MQIINITLGEGSVSVVKQIKIGENLFAIKQFKNRAGQKEYSIHHLLNHPNILKFIVGNEKFIVTELMLPFDLFEFVKSAGSMSVNASNCILKQLAGALKYMHQLRIAHRDIKLENVLVDELNYQVKLCDFNASQSLDEGKVSKMIGTDVYIAPEINSVGTIDAIELQECDIYSLGIMYYILLFGTFPFKVADKSCAHYRLILQNKWGEFWYYAQKNQAKKIPPFCLELIQGMIEINPKKRLTLDEILNSIENINEMEYINEMQRIHTMQQRT